MQPLEFEEKTVERAVKAACEHFGVEEEALEFEIITKGSTGIFGIGGRKAKIRAWPKEMPESAEEKESPLSREKEEEREVDDGGEAAETEPEETSGLADPTPEVLEKARAFLQGIVERTGLSGEVRVEGRILDISGADLSLLIGKDGQCLDAFQHLVNLYVRRQEGRGYLLPLDAQGYRAKRRAAVLRTARELAEKARKSGRPVLMNPMVARERRLVHLELRGFPGVFTRSVGQGEMRRVQIIPQKRGRRPRSRREN